MGTFSLISKEETSRLIQVMRSRLIIGFLVLFVALSSTMADHHRSVVDHHTRHNTRAPVQFNNHLLAKRAADPGMGDEGAGGDSPEKQKWMQMWDEARQFIADALGKDCLRTDDAKLKRECELLMDAFIVKRSTRSTRELKVSEPYTNHLLAKREVEHVECPPECCLACDQVANAEERARCRKESGSFKGCGNVKYCNLHCMM